MTWRRVLVVGGLVLVLLPAVLIVAVMQFAASSWERQQRVIAANERAVLRDLAAVRAARQADRASGGPSAPVLPALPPEKAAGYARRLHQGPTGFAYVAVPLEPGWSGRRAFCVDASGLIRISPEGTDPQAADGVCPTSLLILNEAGAF